MRGRDALHLAVVTSFARARARALLRRLAVAVDVDGHPVFDTRVVSHLLLASFEEFLPIGLLRVVTHVYGELVAQLLPLRRARVLEIVIVVT